MIRPLLLLTLLFQIALGNETSDFQRAPYLQLATHDSVRIVWRTDGLTVPRVRYGPSAEELLKELPASQILRREHPTFSSKQPLYPDAPLETRQFEATIKGLKPDTTYYYAIYDGQKRLTPQFDSYHFTTHPLPGTQSDLHFWVVGDSGTGGRAQDQVHQAMRRHLAKSGQHLDLYLHVGDMAYKDGTNEQFATRFFQIYEPTLRNTVCWASMGNHEGRTSKGRSGTGPFYDAYICPTQGEAGGLPSGKEAFYSFDYGKVHFICLDSHDLDRSSSGEMAQWLKADLEKTKAHFIIAFFHHPPYTKGSHDSDIEPRPTQMRENIMPILESGGVDMIFSGHSHIYERSMLIDGAYHTPTTAEGVILDDGDGDPSGDGPYRKSAGLRPNNGTVAIVAGHGGAGVSRRGTSPIMKRIIVENGSCLVSIDKDTIHVEMLNLHGEIRDRFAIHKSGRIQQTIVAKPWQPEPYTPKKAARKKRPAPQIAQTLIPKEALWTFLAGAHPAGPTNAWTQPDYPTTHWPSARAGFGYGDNDDKTVLDMQHRYQVIYTRKNFKLPANVDLKKLALLISYDDAFIAYLNGHEVWRQGVDHEQGTLAEDYTSHEGAHKFDLFRLRDLSKIAKPGHTNTLAIEGHNVDLKSSDFTLHPTLILTK